MQLTATWECRRDSTVVPLAVGSGLVDAHSAHAMCCGDVRYGGGAAVTYHVPLGCGCGEAKEGARVRCAVCGVRFAVGGVGWVGSVGHSGVLSRCTASNRRPLSTEIVKELAPWLEFGADGAPKIPGIEGMDASNCSVM